MRRFIFSVIVLFIATLSVSAKRDIAPGEWQTVRSYNGITSIIPSKDKVYVVANGGMYVYDKQTKEVSPLSTLDGLSSSAIEKVDYVESTKTLFVMHSDMTIDLVVNGTVFVDESIKESEISGKKVNNLKVDGDKVYISMDAGIVVYNTKKKEVLDTYIIGDDGDYQTVYQTVVLDDCMYALTYDRSTCTQRKLKACEKVKNANDYRSWVNIGLPVSCESFESEEVKQLDCASGALLVLTTKGLYERLSDGSWVDRSPSGIIPTSMQVYKNKLTANTNKQLMAFYKDNLGDVKYRDCEFEECTSTECPLKIAVYDEDENAIWIEKGDGLRKVDLSVDGTVASISEPIIFDGPSRSGYYSLHVLDGDIYLTGNSGYSNPAVVDYCRDGKWHYLRDSLKGSDLNLFRSAHVVVIDPLDKDHVMVPTWWGIYEFYQDTLKYVHNSSNASFASTGECSIVECAWFDEEHNLIATNPSSSGYLLNAMNNEGEWKALAHQNLLEQRYAHRHTRTKNGVDIIVFEYKPCGLGFVDLNKTTFDVSDDKTRLVNTFKYAEDGMMEAFVPSRIYYVEEDLNGDLWIATDKGPLVMKNVKGVFDNMETYVRPKITREDDSRYADYLLASDKVMKIQVDGKNRKWIATEGNGVFLVSPSGDRIIENFTTENSPLSSNAVLDIVYEKETGVLYIMTDNGLFIYATDSSLPEPDFLNVTVYPNPVRPDYEGDIEIKGLMEDSNVRITDQRGTVIENGLSNGGTYRFSARLKDGSRWPTGVYNIFVTTEADEEGISENKHLKFAIIR